MYRIVNNKFFRVILPNMVVIGTFMLITLLILDYYNPLMGFLNRGMSVGFLIVYAALWIMLVITIGMRVCAKSSRQKAVEEKSDENIS